MNALNLRGIANMKRRLTRSILAALGPHMHASGYRHQIDRTRSRFDEGNTRPLRLYVPDKDARLGLYCGEKIEALTEFGMMTDAWGGGAVTLDFADLCLEDLIRIEAWAAKEAAMLRVPLAEKEAGRG